MEVLTAWLTKLLASVIRPIIQEQIAELKSYIVTSLERRKRFEQFDREAQKLAEEMANASTSEERWAILQKIKNNSPFINP